VSIAVFTLAMFETILLVIVIFLNSFRQPDFPANTFILRQTCQPVKLV
jgi:hypothetical protein